MDRFNVVLVEPEIPPNTGNIARLCLAADANLHLIEPLGFRIDDRALRRAGLDYWPLVQKTVWPGWREFWDAPRSSTAHCYFLTTKALRPYHSARFAPGDYLIFGRETKGLPESLLERNKDALLTIPMAPSARSLNLATAVAIVLFEALRQVKEDNPGFND